MATPAVERLKRLSALLDEALDLDEAARADWLARQAGGDADLAGALKRLLAPGSVPDTADLLARGPSFAPPAEEGASRRLSSTFAPGQIVGPWCLLRELGAGGMGEVWLAERADGGVKRQVALKLPMTDLRRATLVQRFERERDILAALEHPHIARLYEAGVANDGQPYLAIEFVEGRPIDLWCRERNAGVVERVQLLLQVVEAVAYAHGRLVLHRDLKPASRRLRTWP